jgi:hypothetical protein
MFYTFDRMNSSLTDFGPMFNNAIAPHNGTATSRDAAESIKPQVNRLCSEVLRCIRNSPNGMTCDEAEVALGMPHQTCSARFRDLAKSEPPFIVKKKGFDGSDLKRDTRSGRAAFVWMVSD